LGEVSDIVRGSSPRPISDSKWFDTNSKVGWLRISDVTSQQGRIKKLDQHLSKLGEEKTRVLLSPHLLLSIAASVGYPVINYVPTGVHDGFLIFKNPKFQLNYGFYWLQNNKNKWQKYGQPGSQVNLNSSIVENAKIFLPNNNEQSKIIALLLRIDKMLALQQRKLNELKEVKKTLLSQLFPSKGQYRPIIRFKKFTNKWTKRKLGNIAKIIGGGTPSTSNHDYWNGNINWYSPTEIGNNIFVNSSNKKISIKGLNNSSAKLLPGGKTILFTSRAGIGNMAIMLTDGCTNQGFQSWVIDDTKIDIYFLYSLGRLLKHDAIRQASGSTFLEISNKEVKKLLLEIPSFTEQKLIGNMLRKIDDDIVRQKERIILITKIKKNLLQKLFV
jgi:type I restriction enzyme S subunit